MTGVSYGFKYNTKAATTFLPCECIQPTGVRDCFEIGKRKNCSSITYLQPTEPRSVDPEVPQTGKCRTSNPSILNYASGTLNTLDLVNGGL